MEKHTLTASPRKVVGRGVKKLRAQGQTPANIFGKNVASLTIQVPALEFTKAFAVVGESSLLYLKVEGEKEDRPVLIRDVTKNPVTGQILHVDFNQVSLKEKITAPVVIKIVGESLAEKEKLGILVQQLNEVEIEALPTEMPEHIEVDVASLAEVDAAILVGDLKLDNKLTLKTDPETVIVKIEKLAAEEKVEAPVTAEGEATAEGQPAEPAAESSDQAPESSEASA